jgi:hypothetical protein
VWQYVDGASLTAGAGTHWVAVGPPDDLSGPGHPDRPWVAPEGLRGPAASAAPTVAAVPVGSAAPGADAPVRLPAPLRPMTVGAQLDGGYDVVRARPRDVLTMTAVFVIPVQLLLAFLNRAALDEGNNAVDDAVFRFIADRESGVLVPFLNVALGWLAHTFAAAAIAFTVVAWYTGGRPTAAEALAQVRRRWLPLVGAWLLVHLLEGVGLVGIGVGALLMMALLLPTVPAMVVEDLGPVAGVKRSIALARPRLGYVLGVALLSGLLAAVIGRALGAIPQLLGYLLGPDVGWVLFGVGSIVADVVTISVTAATSVLVYLDLRIRQEGLDLAWAANRHLPT